MAPPLSPEEKCKGSYNRAERALERLITKCRERLTDGGLNTARKADIEMQYLDAAWEAYKDSYEMLQNKFPEEELLGDDAENPALSRREVKFDELEDLSRDLKRDVLLGEVPAASDAGPKEVDGRRPVDLAVKELERLVSAVRTGLIEIETALVGTEVLRI